QRPDPDVSLQIQGGIAAGAHAGAEPAAPAVVGGNGALGAALGKCRALEALLALGHDSGKPSPAAAPVRGADHRLAEPRRVRQLSEEGLDGLAENRAAIDVGIAATPVVGDALYRGF